MVGGGQGSPHSIGGWRKEGRDGPIFVGDTQGGEGQKGATEGQRHHEAKRSMPQARPQAAREKWVVGGGGGARLVPSLSPPLLVPPPPPPPLLCSFLQRTAS